jgi:hypothetical protein
VRVALQEVVDEFRKYESGKSKADLANALANNGNLLAEAIVADGERGTYDSIGLFLRENTDVIRDAASIDHDQTQAVLDAFNRTELFWSSQLTIPAGGERPRGVAEVSQLPPIERFRLGFVSWMRGVDAADLDEAQADSYRVRGQQEMIDVVRLRSDELVQSFQDVNGRESVRIVELALRTVAGLLYDMAAEDRSSSNRVVEAMNESGHLLYGELRMPSQLDVVAHLRTKVFGPLPDLETTAEFGVGSSSTARDEL